MASLSTQRCLHHPLREAVARCPECGFSFCRECITEHDDRVICAGCLKKILATTTVRVPWIKRLWRPIEAAGAFLCLWLFFFFIAKVLLKVGTSFHDGSVWSALKL